MTPDDDFIADMAKAESIKNTAPDSAISADAIFLALRVGKKPARKYHKSDRSGPPPDWFNSALERLKGRSLSISAFLLHSGRLPASRAERYAVGAWLRASGRNPYKSGGEIRFRV